MYTREQVKAITDKVSDMAKADAVEVLSVLVPSKFVGRKVVLVDELFDHGLTLSAVRAKLLEPPIGVPAGDITTVCLLQKAKETHFAPPDVCGFSQLPDLWVVGCGLDAAVAFPAIFELRLGAYFSAGFCIIFTGSPRIIGAISY